MSCCPRCCGCISLPERKLCRLLSAHNSICTCSSEPQEGLSLNDFYHLSKSNEMEYAKGYNAALKKHFPEQLLKEISENIKRLLPEAKDVPQGPESERVSDERLDILIAHNVGDGKRLLQELKRRRADDQERA